ncbi:RecQ family ATP-dependent DNA helicase [Candidatus Uhrbacteria bacterium]|nr:RecQ family ATP-dependent DNA helicase [Candidatus Uhrbacteria bacterium]
MEQLLKKHFGYDAFRPLQGEVILHVVTGKDALVLMPTGGGKSLCYQLPALVFHGITLVISPLIALMKDQVDALRANGIPAAYINSTLPVSEVMKIEQQAKRGEIKLLYLAPERFAVPQVQVFLQSLHISLLAVDEAHCISEWGHDFRPEYRNLRQLRTLFPNVPLVALTATANVRVREDIREQLSLTQAPVFVSSFNRSNLTYRVQPKKKAFDHLLNEIRERKNQAIIIYCFSRKSTEKVVADLRVNRISAEAYHAGLSPGKRSEIQERFIHDQVSIIVATIAFGMGIDKPDVRLVVHMDLPKSIESYYQETGRAGRDGISSDCLLFFSKGDRFKQELFIQNMASPKERDRARRQLQDMIEYCELSSCRRKFILRYFGENNIEKVCNNCDICVPKKESTLLSNNTEQVFFDDELHEILRDIRQDIANTRGIPPYMIVGDQTLQDMSRYYPQSLSSMSRMFGIGKEKLNQYGQQFVTKIQIYAKTKGIAEIQPRENKKRKETGVVLISSTIQQTVDLFAEKKSITDIAALRNMSKSTIIGHLEQALEQKQQLDLSHITDISIHRFGIIARAFEQAGTYMLAPIRTDLGEEYSYDEIRLVRLMLKAHSIRLGEE